ncbi:DUF72 domain-containing protein [Microbacterium sp. STN6]|uniref:DUF72 domain-containing protein n=1 Tax=Microbacterium sp. STN6 TaxID=2995588 RepID=UPI002260937B|nr:DUF72 domain-containing protein [Microbacterium sp. STN6]MCX7523114.1 DUF72 domain-containing protein [Microbacterium sp. STN6]
MSRLAAGRIIVGTSGWRYPSWRGDFYPAGLRQRDELAYIADRLDSVEINGSFYSLQKPASYLSWSAQTPPGFVFGVKGGRFITHMLRLRGVETALANFFASGVPLLGEKLGPVLWQLPERHTFDAEQLDAFCAQLPRTLAAARELAARHDARVDASWLDDDAPTPVEGAAPRPSRTPASAPTPVEEAAPRPSRNPPPAPPDTPIRYALEPRHPSFDTDACAAVLARHNIALVAAHSGDRWPLMRRLTADFAYVRLHGGPELYASGYTDGELERMAEQAHAWSTGAPDGIRRDVFFYFDNDARGHAPHDAQALMRLCAEPPTARA